MTKIVWLTGPSGAGKTTVAKELSEYLDAIILDGDEMRESISLGAGFSREDRTEHNLRVARLAEQMAKQSNVIVSVIAPIKETRELINDICHPAWVYLKRTVPEREGHFYEEPDADDTRYLTIDHDEVTAEESACKINDAVSHQEFSMFIGRYQPLHDGHKTLINHVLAEGKPVLVAIRDTKLSSSNPYTYNERARMVRAAFGKRVEVVKIPDITEVCYGRKVGWGIRQIRLDEETEAISATKIREAANVV